jgi:integrase/recombinase XerD
MAGLLAAPSISLRSFPMTALRQRMLEDMRVRNLSPHTQSSYILQVSLFVRHFGRSPEELGPEEIRAWQVHLTDDRKLSRSPSPSRRCASFTR